LEECIQIGGDYVSWEEFSKLIIIVTAAFSVPLLHFNRTPDTKLIPLYHSMIGAVTVWSSFTSTTLERESVINNFVTENWDHLKLVDFPIGRDRDSISSEDTISSILWRISKFQEQHLPCIGRECIRSISGKSMIWNQMEGFSFARSQMRVS
jgi:hypothetical protein